jgi:hypothetical protein
MSGTPTAEPTVHQPLETNSGNLKDRAKYSRAIYSKNGLNGDP